MRINLSTRERDMLIAALEMYKESLEAELADASSLEDLREVIDIASIHETLARIRDFSIKLWPS